MGALCTLALFGLSNHTLSIALAAIAVYAGGRLFFRKDEAREDRRRNAQQLSHDAQREGLGFLSPILDAYAVGDYSALLHELRAFHDRLRDPEHRRAIFDQLFKRQIELRMSEPTQRAQLIELLEGARETNVHANATR